MYEERLSLSQTDSKVMLSKTLAVMLLEVAADLIHPNKVPYLKRRFIGEGVKITEGIIEYIKEFNLIGYLFAIDFEQAFDSLERFFLWLSLGAYGFPKRFIDYLKILYKNIEACVVNGGTSTKYFQITRAIKQGCPASGILFVLALELFCIKTRASDNIRGIAIMGTEVKLSGYADDINIFYGI